MSDDMEALFEEGLREVEERGGAVPPATPAERASPTSKKKARAGGSSKRKGKKDDAAGGAGGSSARKRPKQSKKALADEAAAEEATLSRHEEKDPNYKPKFALPFELDDAVRGRKREGCARLRVHQCESLSRCMMTLAAGG